MKNKLLSFGLGEAVSKGLNILLILLLPFFLDVEEFAIVSLLVAAEQLLLSITLMGNNTVAIRFYSKFKSKYGIFHRTILVGSFVRSIVLTFIALVLISIFIKLESALKVYLLIAVSMPLLVFLEVEVAIFRAKNALNNYIVTRITYSSIRFLLTFILLASYSGPIAYSFSVFISSLIVFAGLIFFEYPLLRQIQSKKLNTLLAKYSIPLGLQAVIAVMYSVIDRFMLNDMLDKSAVAIYSFSSTLAMAMFFFASVVVAVLLPDVYKNQNDIERSLYKLKKLIGKVVLLFIPSSIITILIFKLYTNYISEQYASGLLCVIIINLSLYVHLGYLYSFYKLNLFKSIKFVPFVGGVALLSNVFLNIKLIPILGIEGAAFSTLISEGVSFLMLYIFSTTIFNGRAKLRW